MEGGIKERGRRSEGEGKEEGRNKGKGKEE